MPQDAHHHPVLRAALHEPPHEQDALYRRAAWKNLRDHPGAYARNLAANLSRLFFSFPYTHTRQKLSTLLYVVPNAFLLSALAWTIVHLLRHPRRLKRLFPWWAFAGVALAATLPISAYPRFLLPLVPFLLVLIFLGLENERA
jgi:hypothetical protein